MSQNTKHKNETDLKYDAQTTQIIIMILKYYIKLNNIPKIY